MCTVDSGSVKPRQSNKTVWCTCFLYKHDVYKHIQAQVWWFFKHMYMLLNEFFHTDCFFLLSIAKHFPSDSSKMQQNKWRSLETRWPIILRSVSQQQHISSQNRLMILFHWNFYLLFLPASPFINFGYFCQLWIFLPTFLPFIAPSSFIILAEIYQPPRLFRPPLLFETRE